MTKHSVKINRSLRLLVLLAVAFLASACSTKQLVEGDQPNPAYFDTKLLEDESAHYGPKKISDPFEGFNRTMYRFNYRADKYVLLPIVDGYKFITPDIAEKGIGNFFKNIGEISTLYNSIFQLNFKKTYQTTARFLTNTTVGLLGFIDVASYIGIQRHKEDFGQTLGYWGVPSGPYLVIPFLGPSSLRDGGGSLVDTSVISALRAELEMKPWEETTWTLLGAINSRAKVPFRYYESGSPFEYELIRGLWLNKRQLDIEK